ncbi:MAG: alanine--tRNA ligase [Candidatus Taylorbacteria bacterium]|nr:alanine--tRNA ligase [Candidatus Taylorbacteria bacterium]
MNSIEIRQRFLAFFEKRGHAIIPSASLVTPDEQGVTNSTLFNTAGMQPLVPYLLGKPHPAGTRLVDVQKCLRTVDLDEVGDATHATFFEMLGNWSLGDYFKKEAINWSYEFLTNSTSAAPGDQGLGLDPNRLYITVFEGDANATRDNEAADIWREIFRANGVDENRIYYMGADKNWWEAGENGPCGPDTEMYYDVSNSFGGKALTREEFIEADKSGKVVEVWNDVFMQYEKKNGKIVGNLPKPSVDTGAGLERLAMTLQGVDNIYDTDLLASVLELTKKWSLSLRGQRILADHIRAATFLINDGIIPSNTDRGYILRRLIRRAIINTTTKKISDKDISDVVDSLATIYKTSYPDLVKNSANIKKVLGDEAVKFSKALEFGLLRFEKITGFEMTDKDQISAQIAFDLYQNYGFPIESTIEMAEERNLKVDVAGFNRLLEEHQKLSRVGAEKKFKGGLADSSDEMVVRYHTATHLLHQALHDVLGEDVAGQKGSNITTERLRFDFACTTKMTDEQKMKVEKIVNDKIRAKLPVNKVAMDRDEAEKTGARHFFGEKYGDKISIYYIGTTMETAYSKEFCGGPHVRNTAELAGPDGKWRFRITKEEAISQGVRRIKAVLTE